MEVILKVYLGARPVSHIRRARTARPTLLVRHITDPSHPMVRCSRGLFGDMRSLHSASTSATATGFVHKPRGDNTVCISLQLKMCCVVCVSVL